jgi:hypothetical protein
LLGSLTFASQLFEVRGMGSGHVGLGFVFLFLPCTSMWLGGLAEAFSPDVKAAERLAGRAFKVTAIAILGFASGLATLQALP